MTPSIGKLQGGGGDAGSRVCVSSLTLTTSKRQGRAVESPSDLPQSWVPVVPFQGTKIPFVYLRTSTGCWTLSRLFPRSWLGLCGSRRIWKTTPHLGPPFVCEVAAVDLIERECCGYLMASQTAMAWRIKFHICFHGVNLSPHTPPVMMCAREIMFKLAQAK